MVFFHHARFWVFTDIGMPWAVSHRISHDACCWVWGWLLCCWSGLSALMVVPSGLGLPVLPWSRSRLWRGSGIRWTGILPCRSGPSGTRVQHRDRTPPDAGPPPTSGNIGRAYGCGFRRYRIGRARAMASISDWIPGIPAISAAGPRPAGLPISLSGPPVDIVSAPPPADIYGYGRGRAMGGVADIGRVPPGH